MSELKSDSCVWCNKPLISGQQIILYGILQKFDGIPSLKPSHQYYHADCYEDMHCQCLMEDGWRKDK